MSQSIGVSLTYDLPYAAEQVVKVVETINKAVQVNWERYCDQWSEPEPKLLPIRIWGEAAQPEQLEEWELVGLRKIVLDFQDESFSYSPLSWYHVFMSAGEDLRADRTGKLTIRLYVSATIRGEHEAALEAHRMRTALEADPTLDEDDAWFDRFHELRNRERSVWPENRACLLHIIEELKRALPVRDVKMSEVLLEP